MLAPAVLSNGQAIQPRLGECREAACPEGAAVCGCESLISKWLCERSRFRTVLKSGSGLSVAALWAGVLQRSARIVPLAEGVQ